MIRAMINRDISKILRAMEAKCPNHSHRRAIRRGVCITCYDMLAKRVQRGTTTWRKLQNQGVIKPVSTAGRKLKSMKRVTTP